MMHVTNHMFCNFERKCSCSLKKSAALAQGKRYRENKQTFPIRLDRHLNISDTMHREEGSYG
jgi:hypothetical protein